MKTIKDYEAIYTKVFNWHKKHICYKPLPHVTSISEFESDLIDAVVSEIQNQINCKDMESYKPIYRRVLNWHEEHTSPTTKEDWKKIVDSFKQFNESSEFERAMIVAAAEEIQRNHKE